MLWESSMELTEGDKNVSERHIKSSYAKHWKISRDTVK